MNNDFEVHPIGTATEIKLSRELANAISQELISFGQVVPQSVFQAYKNLCEHYKDTIESENA